MWAAEVRRYPRDYSTWAKGPRARRRGTKAVWTSSSLRGRRAGAGRLQRTLLSLAVTGRFYNSRSRIVWAALRERPRRVASSPVEAASAPVPTAFSMARPCHPRQGSCPLEPVWIAKYTSRCAARPRFEHRSAWFGVGQQRPQFDIPVRCAAALPAAGRQLAEEVPQCSVAACVVPRR